MQQRLQPVTITPNAGMVQLDFSDLQLEKKRGHGG